MLDVSDVGQKAAQLARLARAGLAVPPGFALSARALDAHLDAHLSHCSLRAAVAAAVGAAANDDAAAAAVYSLIVGSDVPAEVRAAVLAARTALAGVVIVRSSAVGEDGDDASFAGQLDSFSGIDIADDEALLLAVKRCWASAWSARALFYQRAKNRPLGGVGVVIQSFVDAAVSGVLFTVAPDDDASVYGEFVFGAGEALVSGRVTPGSLRGPRGGSASVLSWPEQDDTRVEVDADAIVAAGTRIEALFAGVPQDIEWCVDRRGALFIVQARPITTTFSPASTATTTTTTTTTTATPAVQQPVRFSNANVNENFPTPITPMLFSIARKGYAAYFKNLGHVMGIGEDRIAAVQPALDSLVGAHSARLYYNLSSLHGCLRAAPFGDWLTSSFNVFVGVDSGAAESSTLLEKTSVLREAQAAAALITRGSLALATTSRRLPTFEKDVDDFAAASQPSLLAHLDDAQLEGLVRRFLEIREHRWGAAALSDVSAMVGYGALRSLLGRFFPDADETLQNDLLKGLADVVSGIPTQKLWELAQLKRSNDPRFDVTLAMFLEQWGFRRSGELLLTVPTFAEDPAPVLALIEQLAIEGGESPDAITQKQARAREQKTQTLLSTSPWALRPGLSALLRFTRSAIGLRERARLKQALLYTRLRMVLLEVGARLVARGDIDVADDVFFLGVDELIDHLAGISLFGAMVRETIALRRSQHERLSAESPADAFVIERGRWQPPVDAATSTDVPGDALKGTPAAGGRARGRAAVLRDVQEAARMQRGDILVTKQTDPGWGPVLFLAKALVIERGGMLSHGAIIAREFGVPCVVGVKNASTRIAHGAHIDVDGDRGLVIEVAEVPPLLKTTPKTKTKASTMSLEASA